MAQITLWGSQQFAQMLLGRSVPVPEEFYLALVRTDTEPDAFISGMELDEPTEAGYARVLLPNDAEHWQTTLETVMNNAQEARFPAAAEDWGGISYWALCNAESEGYVYLWGNFLDEIYVATGDVVVIDPDALQFEFNEIYEEVSNE